MALNPAFKMFKAIIAQMGIPNPDTNTTEGKYAERMFNGLMDTFSDEDKGELMAFEHVLKFAFISFLNNQNAVINTQLILNEYMREKGR